MRSLFTVCLILAATFSAYAQQFTLPEPPAFLANPYQYSYERPNLKNLSEGVRINNDDNFLIIPETVPLKPHHEDKDRRYALGPFLDYLKATAVSDPRSKDYNGPEYILDSGYRLRQTEGYRWQLFSAKLKPKGEAFSHLPLPQPFTNQFLACNRNDCELRDERGKLIDWAKTYDLVEYTSTGHLINLDRGQFGLLDQKGEAVLFPTATGIGDKNDHVIWITAGKSHKLLYYPNIDFLSKEDSYNEPYQNRYFSTSNNVFDAETRSWLVSPDDAKNLFISINQYDGLILVVEFTPKPGVYPGRDSIGPIDFVIHFVTIDGEYLTSSWTKHFNTTYNPFTEEYKIGFREVQEPLTRFNDTEYFYLDRQLNPIFDVPQPVLTHYYGPDSVHVFEDEWRYLIKDRKGDTLFCSRGESQYYQLRGDKILLSEHVNFVQGRRLDDPESASYVFDTNKKSIVDTLPYLRQLENDDFVGFKTHLNSFLEPINDKDRLKAVLGQKTSFPYSQKRLGGVQNFYTYEGELVQDDFGNESFGDAKHVDEQTSLLIFRKRTKNSGYASLHMKDRPDVILNRNYVEAQSIDRDDLMSLYGSSSCGIMLKNGTVIVQDIKSFVDTYTPETGLFRIRFGDFSRSELLTYRGDFPFAGHYKRVVPQTDGSFIVSQDNLLGLYDYQGEILPPIFSQLYQLTGNIYHARLPGDKKKYVVRNGRLLR